MFYKLWETLYCSIFSYITCIYDNILNIHTKGFLVIVNVAPVFGGKLALLGKAGKITAVSTFRFAAVVPCRCVASMGSWSRFWSPPPARLTGRSRAR